ncbi:hypothetical protein BC351_00300 [Paenibacillus ferrarius]|uniref:Uncharacterized protein n=1 Tax=Paenibacillus ferrarius TaxID=1469647 RepID=A0A1V4HS48_9BACL|nr:hypothetical protein [Paenibacillus ferrarius]OPH61717.1 hypothetical protein BC351_00300 [Paenibacillus ferrarius]
MADRFLVSVADVIMRDPSNDTIVAKGKTLINTAFKQAVTNQEVRGGFGNGLAFTYSHDKKIDVSVEAANFEVGYIALNNGVGILNGLKDYFVTDELVTLVGGSGAVASTPVGSVYVQKSDGSILTVTPTGKNFTLAGGANSTVYVSYQTSTSVDYISIDADKYPNAYEVTLIAKIFEGKGQVAELQIKIPQFKISGSFDLSLAAASVSTSKLEGSALVDTNGNYATVMIKPVGNTAVSYQAIAATPAAVSLSAASPTSQITVYGIRGGIYANTVVTSGCTYVSSTPATCTVGASTGLITRVAAGSSTITVTHTSSGITDTVVVTSA